MGLFDQLFPSKEEPSADWSTAPGEIYSATVRPWSRNVYVAEIGYSYSAGGEYYSGYFQQLFVSEDAADAFLAPFLKGRKIVVHYRPGKPDISTLFKQDMKIAS